jgi:WD40 repeat protein
LNETTPRLWDVYLGASEIMDPDQRRRFIDERCSHAPELRSQVQQLLQQGAADADFMSVPAGLMPELVAEFAQTSDEPLQPGFVIERYQLLRQLGHGGMGTVFQAKQLEPVERLVALKILRSGFLTAGAAARVEAERQTLAVLKHPGIVSVLDAGRLHDGRPWFVMDYVAGASLTTFCQEQHLHLADRLRLMIELCDAVRHAHFRGIIHQDLKPSNVLVERVDGRPVCRLIDFGIRRDLGSGSEGAGPRGGTPDYMSPEQSSGNSTGADTRSDVFALGRILAELVFGSPRAADADATLTAEPFQLTGRRRRELFSIVQKATREQPADRYASAEDLADDLQRFLDGRAVQAIPDQRLYRIGRFAARHWLPLVLAILTLLSLTAGLLVSVRQTLAAQAAERRANRYLEVVQLQKQQFRSLAWNSAIQQAWTAWESGKLPETQRILDTMTPAEAAADRHAEWTILRSQLQSAVRTRRISQGPIHELRAVPGRELVAAACEDGILRLIHSATGEIEREVPAGISALHSLDVDAAGQRIAVGSAVDKVTDRSRIRIYHIETGTWSDGFPPQFTTIELLSFSGDGRFLLCGPRYEHPLILRADDGSVVTTLPTERRNLWGAISQNGDRAIVAAANHVVYLDDRSAPGISGETGQKRTFEMHQHVIAGFLFPDSGHLCCLVDGTDSLLLVDIDSRRTLASLEYAGKPRSAQLGPRGESLLITTDAGEILCWDLTKLNAPAALSLSGEPGDPQRRFGDEWIPSLKPEFRWLLSDEPVISVCDSGTALLAGSPGGDLHFLPRSLSTWQQLDVSHPEAAAGELQQLTVDPARSALLLGYRNGLVLRLNAPQRLRSDESPHRDALFPLAHALEEIFPATAPPRPLAGIAFTPESGGHLRWLQQTGQLWVRQADDTGKQRLLAEHDASLDSERNEFAGYSPDGTLLAYSQNRTLHVVPSSTAGGERFATEFDGYISAFCWHPDGESLLIAGAFKGLRQWFPESGRLLSPPGMSEEICQLAVSSAASLLVAGDQGGRVAVWDLSETSAKYQVGSQIHQGEIYALCLLDGGRVAVSVDEQLEVVFWMTRTGRRLGRLVKLPGECMHGMDVLQLFTTPQEDRLVLAWLRLRRWVQVAAWELKK